MTVGELIERLQHLVTTGAIERDAVVVRPFCTCDQDVGYVEAKFVDQVIRRWEQVGTAPEERIYRYGDVPPGESTATTVKLG
jgi:hypothetical protein